MFYLLKADKELVIFCTLSNVRCDIFPMGKKAGLMVRKSEPWEQLQQIGGWSSDIPNPTILSLSLSRSLTRLLSFSRSISLSEGQFEREAETGRETGWETEWQTIDNIEINGGAWMVIPVFRRKTDNVSNPNLYYPNFDN